MSMIATLGLGAVCLTGLALLLLVVYARRSGTADGGSPETRRAGPAESTAGRPPADEPLAEGGFETAPPSDEEIVFRLLDASDGQLPQSDVVGDTDWSKSKVSRVLSRMDDEGTITKIDIGRGNVITRRGEEPPGAARPFEN